VVSSGAVADAGALEVSALHLAVGFGRLWVRRVRSQFLFLGSAAQ